MDQSKAKALYVALQTAAHNREIFRGKGILSTTGCENKTIFQSVHDSFDILESDEPWGQAERKTEIIFIGRGLDENELSQGLATCV